jgi:hypothetical protein
MRFVRLLRKELLLFHCNTRQLSNQQHHETRGCMHLGLCPEELSLEVDTIILVANCKLRLPPRLLPSPIVLMQSNSQADSNTFWFCANCLLLIAVSRAFCICCLSHCAPPFPPSSFSSSHFHDFVPCLTDHQSMSFQSGGRGGGGGNPKCFICELDDQSESFKLLTS